MEKFPKICYLNYVRRGVVILVYYDAILWNSMQYFICIYYA